MSRKPRNRFHGLDVKKMRDTGVTDYDIVAVYFPGREAYETNLRVFQASVRQNTSGKLVLIVPDVHRKRDDRTQHFNNNLLKSEAWSEYAETMTRPAVFMDIDILVLGDLAQGFQRDITITRRNNSSWFNGGAVWAMPTDSVRQFFRQWHTRTEQFYRDPRANPLRGGHVGLHQACFVDLLARGQMCGASVGVLPGEIWNATRSCWSHFDPAKTKVLHMTCALTKFADDPPKEYREAMDCYRKWMEDTK